MTISYPRVASFRSTREIASHLESLGWALPVHDQILPAPLSPLAHPLEIITSTGPRSIGNRFAVQPMEGWDGESDGRPSELTRRRWLRMATSGAKLLWGCEAIAVLPEARANPNQLMLNGSTARDVETLRLELVEAHKQRFGTADDLFIGLQLTHSGRFCRPHEKSRLEPAIVYHHPVLDSKYPPSAQCEPISDATVGSIIDAYAEAARLATNVGFDFVDLKSCHGYLGHEFLSAHRRKGRYGGCLDNRTRFLRELIAAVRSSAPRLEIGVRLSAYDSLPFTIDSQTGRGTPVQWTGPYDWAFGVERTNPAQPDLTEARHVIRILRDHGVRLLNVSAGSPYHSAHLQRPAIFPPCDSYPPPEDPLAGAARLLCAARELKAEAKDMIVVSSGWSYFQDYLAHFAQAHVEAGWSDCVGLGRMMLSYPDLPADILSQARFDRKKICRTFSDCTNGPRNGMVSGCYPLDAFYRDRQEGEALRTLKKEWARA